MAFDISNLSSFRSPGGAFHLSLPILSVKRRNSKMSRNPFDQTGFSKSFQTEFPNRNSRDLLLTSTPVSRGSSADSLKGVCVCVGVSMCSYGWMMIRIVLLSNQQLLIHLTQQINKAGHPRGVCACVRPDSVSQ